MKTTRENIIRSYLTLGTEKGFDNVSLEDIAQNCGITKATIFSHFENYAALKADALALCKTALDNADFSVNFRTDYANLFTGLANSAIDTFSSYPLDCYFSLLDQKGMTDPAILHLRADLNSMFRARILVALDYAVQRSWLETDDTDSLSTVLAACMYEGIRRELSAAHNHMDFPDIWDSFISVIDCFRDSFRQP